MSYSKGEQLYNIMKVCIFIENVVYLIYQRIKDNTSMQDANGWCKSSLWNWDNYYPATL